jgi:hypothetical protein
MGALIPLAAVYVIVAFTASDPLLRIVLRCLPVLPAAVWTLWLDPSRPLDDRPPAIRLAVRLALLLLLMALTIVLLGVGLNWLYDPRRVV